MPYTRPTLTELNNLVAQDLAAVGPLLRLSNMGVVGKALAGLSNAHYGYQAYVAKQSNPYTATDEWLEAWAALKGVYRKAAAQASGSVLFTGTAGATIPSGRVITRADGASFTTTASATISAEGTATVAASADADPNGLLGASGNTAVGTAMTLVVTILGVLSTGAVSSAFIGGADLESDDSLRTRMLYAYQNPPLGGARSDYVAWALSASGVTRAWCVPLVFGAGTVGVYFMMDLANIAFDGFPQGTDGVAVAETRAITATGDQSTVAEYLYTVQPVPALVYALTPQRNAVNFSISGVPFASRAAVTAAIADVLLRSGNPDGVTPVALSDVWSAIAATSGVTSFTMSSPSADIHSAQGYIPTVGTVTYS